MGGTGPQGHINEGKKLKEKTVWITLPAQRITQHDFHVVHLRQDEEVCFTLLSLYPFAHLASVARFF